MVTVAMTVHDILDIIINILLLILLNYYTTIFIFWDLYGHVDAYHCS